MAPDELHGVEVEAVVLADPIDRNDMRVVQPRRGAGLASEPLQPGRVAEMMEGERLQGDVPPQRFLDRLVDDPHAAGADAAGAGVIAQALGHRVRLSRSGPAEGRSPGRHRSRALP